MIILTDFVSFMTRKVLLKKLGRQWPTKGRQESICTLRLRVTSNQQSTDGIFFIICFNHGPLGTHKVRKRWKIKKSVKINLDHYKDYAQFGQIAYIQNNILLMHLPKTNLDIKEFIIGRRFSKNESNILVSFHLHQPQRPDFLHSLISLWQIMF